MKNKTFKKASEMILVAGLALSFGSYCVANDGIETPTESVSSYESVISEPTSTPTYESVISEPTSTQTEQQN